MTLAADTARAPRRLGTLGLRLAGAGAILGAAAVGGICIGETRIPAGTVLAVLANRLFDAGIPVDPIDEGIIWAYRLTRALVAGACGAGLAVCGVIRCPQAQCNQTRRDPLTPEKGV